VLTAKEAANVDWLSEGRFEFGVGLGWSRAEYRSNGYAVGASRDRSHAYLELITRLWSEDIAAARGRLE
jgi:alkanesulfonate monooxygenase SsuD/methylene tetrahydromethanopterin reductase-like flavin-dependent oxidoreductase (luciferase family)